MNSSTFIRSFYYPPVPKAARHVEQDTVKCQRPIVPPAVPEHYITPKPLVPSKQLIESTYCMVSRETKEYPRLSTTTTTKDTKHIEGVDQRPLASALPPETYSTSQDHHQPYEAVPKRQTTACDNTTCTQIVQKDELLHKQKGITGDSLPKYEVSEYVWQRLDKEREELYAMRPNYGPADEYPTACFYEKLEKIAENTNGSEFNDVNSKQNTVKELKPTSEQLRESEYVGFQNDVYPAYQRSTACNDSSVVKKSPTNTFVVQDIDYATVDVGKQSSSETGEGDNHIDIDIENCHTAVETPAYQSHIACVMKPNESHTCGPYLVGVPYCTQFSKIGNAFDPVGQPQISEYHLEDLNDLVSCIDGQ
uniref:Zasp-like motif domain-containing protein n=1 Tax=Angiostrongylus cantonensis TaxID=6313 RepID=A0A0K0CVQ5_ANGCA